GWYSVRDEAYYDASELVDGEGGEKLSPQGTPVEWTVEESWFFRLSRYAEPLLQLYSESPDFLRPESRRNEVMRFVEGGLRDLSVSRTSFDWGVKVPGSEDHVMYVWVDALTNYLTGLGFPDESDAFAKWWPADVHLIGKDIVRFHAVYWPAFLMSAGLSLPRQVFGHGFLLNRGQKESKSLGNVTDPLELADRFGVDPLRYFLMREVAFGQDGSYSPEAIVTRANAELTNSFGNLAQRSLSMIFKNLDGELSIGLEKTDADLALEASIHAHVSVMRASFESMAFSDGLEEWMRAVFACNQYVDEQAPWALRKTDPMRMAAVLMVLFRCVRTLAIAVRPVVPAAADALLDQMGVHAEARDYAALEDADWFANLAAGDFRIGQPVGVFPRLEMPVEAEA
ncbi:MAG: methionine--tRNA ligase, partial [Novosphingobium sp.]